MRSLTANEGRFEMLAGKKILVTGATGQVARPVADLLAEKNEVWCLGRFTDPHAQRALADRGMRTWHWDMSSDGLNGLPDDFSHVLHAAVERGDDGDFEKTINVNTGAVGRLMNHCRAAESFLFVSTGVVYARQGLGHRYAETDPIGTDLDWLPTYPVGKLAAEGAVRACAAALGVPTTIARLNAAYGPYGHGGIPVMFYKRMLNGEGIEIPREGQDFCSPIHTDDIARQVPLLWSVATIPTTVVNWGGDDAVGIQDLMTHISEMTRVPVKFIRSEVTRAPLAFDNTVRRGLIGECTVAWRDGVYRTLQAHFPNLMNADAAGRF